MRQDMKRVKEDGTNVRQKIGRPNRRRLWIMAAIGLAASSVAIAGRAYNWRPVTESVVTAAGPAQPVAAQTPPPFASRYLIGLAFQPEADRMRRRLGRRFLSPGRELLALSGVLAVGKAEHQVRLVRSQEDDGERLAVAIDGGPSLTWSAGEGTKSVDGKAASESERSQVERMVMDSADAFVLAQLRGASYYTIAHDVRPPAAASSEAYEGAVWDIVRIGEPKATMSQIASPWRLFYINSDTGLLDRVVSQEGGESVVADLSAWVDQGGEAAPTQITWTRSGQVVMKLTVTSMEISSK